MSKLTLTEAVSVIPVSESTLRRDLKSGKVSFETDAKGRKQIDVSELTSVYGLKTDSADPVIEAPQKPSMNGNDTPQPQIVDLLTNQVTDLKAQLEKADARESQLIAEKTTLLDMLSREQQRSLPPPEAEEEPDARRGNWLTRLFGF